MKKILLILFLFIGVVLRSQVTYNPVNSIPFNKPFGAAQAIPTDARTYFYDPALFLYRPYASTSEVLSYLNLPKYRTGQFDIIVQIAGVNYCYWFKDGTADGNLVLKYPFVGTSSQVMGGDGTLINIGSGLSGGSTLQLTNTGVIAGPYSLATYQVDTKGRLVASANALINNVGNGTASWFTSTHSAAGLTVTDLNTRLFHDTTYLSWHIRGDGSIFGLLDTSGLRSAFGGGGGGGGVWGSITGTLSAQTDLQTALNGKLSTALNSAQIYIGNGSNIATATSPTGAWTITNAGVSTLTANSVVTSNITNNNVTYGKIQQVNATRLTGNAGGVAANMSEIPVTDGIKFSGGNLVADTAFIYNNARVDTIRIVPVGASGFQTIYGNGKDTIFAKRLVAGSNVTLTQNTDSSITINSSGGGGFTLNNKQVPFGNLSNVPISYGNFTYDSTFKSLTLDKTSSDSGAIVIKQNFFGIKPWFTIKPPFDTALTTSFKFYSQISANDDGRHTNHVVKFGSNLDFEKPTQPAIWDAWEGNWFEGGSRKMERHMAFQFFGGPEYRFFSATLSVPDSANISGQLDFRGSSMNYYTLKGNQQYFGVAGNGTKGFNMALNSPDDSLGIIVQGNNGTNPGVISVTGTGVTQAYFSLGSLFFQGSSSGWYLDNTNGGLTHTIINQSTKIQRTGAWPVSLGFADIGGGVLASIGADGGAGNISYNVPSSWGHHFFINSNPVLKVDDLGNINYINSTSTNANYQSLFNVGNDASKVARLGIYGTSVSALGDISGGDAFIYSNAPHFVVMSNSGPISFAPNGTSIKGMFANSGSFLLGTTTDVASSLLTLNSTTKGFLPPVMTSTQRTGISSPATGLLVFDSDTLSLFAYTGSAWLNLHGSGSGGGGGSNILNQTTLQSSANFNIDGYGLFGTSSAKIGVVTLGDAPLIAGVHNGTHFPYISMYNSSGGTNDKVMDWYLDDAGTYHGRLLTDAFGTPVDFLTQNRSGTTPGELDFGASSVKIAGTQLSIGGASLNGNINIIDANPFIEVDRSGTNAFFLGSAGDIADFAINRNPTTGTFNQTDKAMAQIRLASSSGDGNIQFYTGNTNNTFGAEAMRINKDQEVQIGSTTDQGAFTLQNTGGFYQNGSFSLRATLAAPSGGLPILVHGIDSVVYQVAQSSLTGVPNIYNANGTVGANRTVTQSGHWIDFTGEIYNNHLYGNGTAPSISAGLGAGTSPTVSISGTDQAGIITITPGVGGSTSAALVTVTYNSTYAAKPVVVITPANSASGILTAGIMPYINDTNCDATKFEFDTGTSALTAATTYKFYYHVIGYDTSQ